MNDKILQYHLGQSIVGSFTKLGKICFSIKCLTADISQFFGTNIKICLLGGLGTCYQIRDFLQIF